MVWDKIVALVLTQTKTAIIVVLISLRQSRSALQCLCISLTRIMHFWRCSLPNPDSPRLWAGWTIWVTGNVKVLSPNYCSALFVLIFKFNCWINVNNGLQFHFKNQDKTTVGNLLKSFTTRTEVLPRCTKQTIANTISDNFNYHFDTKDKPFSNDILINKNRGGYVEQVAYISP